jgi:hypothetical protein
MGDEYNEPAELVPDTVTDDSSPLGLPAPDKVQVPHSSSEASVGLEGGSIMSSDKKVSLEASLSANKMGDDAPGEEYADDIDFPLDGNDHDPNFPAMEFPVCKEIQISHEIIRYVCPVATLLGVRKTELSAA